MEVADDLWDADGSAAEIAVGMFLGRGLAWPDTGSAFGDDAVRDPEYQGSPIVAADHVALCFGLVALMDQPVLGRKPDI